ncbi:hypothetical protein KCU73_g7553, partial [Aureobasidium melanogenum]
MIFSIFASLFSPATTTTMEYAPSPLSSTPLSSCSHVLSTTTLSFDPMEVDYITMPQGTKRKLNQLYQSMGELPRKGPKTEPVFKNKELLAASKFEKKQQLRAWYNALVATPAYEAMTSLLAKETSMKSLFFRRKNNSFSFDFVVLASNSELTTTSSFAKSPSHDSAMYIFKANSKQVLTGEFNILQQPSSTLSPAPVSAPSSDLQDASMNDAMPPVAESTELPLSHPSRLGNSILCRKKDSYDSWAYTLTSALKDVEKAVRTGKKSYTVPSSCTGKKPTGISKKSKTRAARHHAASQAHLQVPVRNRNRMPFDIEEDGDDDDKPETSTPLAVSTPTPSPAHVATLSSPSVDDTAISTSSIPPTGAVLPLLTANLVILTKRAEGKKPELRDNQIATKSSNKSQTLSKKKQETSKSDLKITKNRGVVKNRHDRKVRPLRTAPELTTDKVTSFSKQTVSLIKRNQNQNKEDEVSKLFKKVLVDDPVADGADFVAFS